MQQIAIKQGEIKWTHNICQMGDLYKKEIIWKYRLCECWLVTWQVAVGGAAA